MRIRIFVLFLSSCIVHSLKVRDNIEQTALDEPLPKRAAAYHWNNSYGPSGKNTHVSPYMGPRNLKKSIQWNWTLPDGRFSGLFIGGPLVDDEKNFYITTSDDGIWKVSPEGKTLLNIIPPPSFGKMVDAVALWDGKVIGSSKSGIMWAANKDTGELVWQTRMGKDCGDDSGFITVGEGVALSGFDSGPVDSKGQSEQGSHKVAAVNATNGQLLWTFDPDQPAWNFMGIFQDDGTFVYQNKFGGVYRIRLSDGTLLWKSGVEAGFTDGGLGVGPNGVVYSVAAEGSNWYPNMTGWVTATRISDGTNLWRTKTPLIPNSYPVVGKVKVGNEMKDMLVVAQGLQGMKLMLPVLLDNFPSDQAVALNKELIKLGDGAQDVFHTQTLYSQIAGLDPETGNFLWQWEPPAWRRPAQAGDNEGLEERLRRKKRTACFPGPWSSPAIDAGGTVYAGNQNGVFYAISDVNGDGKITAETEVSDYDMGACFLFPGATILPGQLVMSSCDTLFAFRDE